MSPIGIFFTIVSALLFVGIVVSLISGLTRGRGHGATPVVPTQPTAPQQPPFATPVKEAPPTPVTQQDIKTR